MVEQQRKNQSGVARPLVTPSSAILSSRSRRQPANFVFRHPYPCHQHLRQRVGHWGRGYARSHQYGVPGAGFRWISCSDRRPRTAVRTDFGRPALAPGANHPGPLRASAFALANQRRCPSTGLPHLAYRNPSEIKRIILLPARAELPTMARSLSISTGPLSHRIARRCSSLKPQRECSPASMWRGRIQL